MIYCVDVSDQDLIARTTSILRNALKEQFKKGLSFRGVLDVLQRFPLEAFKELTYSKEAAITPEYFECVFEVNLSTQGSNVRVA